MTTSPLHALHDRLGARFVDFAGWEMPVHYGGTLAEHRAVRSGVGVFDVPILEVCLGLLEIARCPEPQPFQAAPLWAPEAVRHAGCSAIAWFIA